MNRYNIYMLKSNGDLRRGFIAISPRRSAESLAAGISEYAVWLCTLPENECGSIQILNGEPERKRYEQYIQELQREANGQPTRDNHSSDDAGDSQLLLEFPDAHPTLGAQ